MTVAAADDAGSKGRSWPVRAALYLAIQAAIVLASILLLELPLPTPEERYGLTEATLTGDAGEQIVTLPYRLSQGSAPLYRFSLSFDRPAGARDEAWSVLIPRFVRAVEVAINGADILDSRRHPAANRPDRSTPEIATIPAALLKDGANLLTIRLRVWGPLSGFLDRVYVGPDEALRPAFEARSILFVALPVVFAAWQAILAALLGVMWVKRRHEPAYGILAAAMALGVFRIFAYAPAAQSAYPRLNAILIASAPLEAACVVIFVIAFLGIKPRRWHWTIFAPGVLIAAIGLFNVPDLVGAAYIALAPATILLALVLTGSMVGYAAVMRGDGIAALLGSAVTFIVASAVHDLLVTLDVAVDSPILLGRLAYSALLVAIGIGLTWRFANALNEVDSFAGRMVKQVREAEDKLRANLALEEERARAAALAAERNRLMRDLHDGLGGQLVSIVALSERSAVEGDRIGDAARAALRDLRLVIDAMDDIDGDLMLALGAWRERTAALLRSHGLPLEWHVLTPQGIPVHPELRPWHVIQILRMLDEAVTNAVKHAGASRIGVAIETLNDGSGRITVEDDGRGFTSPQQSQAAVSKATRGLANMRRRASRCNIRLEIVSGPGGTKVCLDLPRQFPSGDPAAA